MKYSDGSPAIMERTWGRGRVILFGSTANTQWNDLPLRPAYLPLDRADARGDSETKEAEINLPVGAPFEFVCDPDWIEKDALIKAPGEEAGGSLLRRIGVRGWHSVAAL